METEPGVVVVDDQLAAVGPMNGALVRFFDVSDPAQPQPLGTYSNSNVSAADLSLVDRILYIGDNEGLSVVDIADIDHANEIGRYDNDNWASGFRNNLQGKVTPRVTTSMEHLYLAADSFGVDVLDVSTPSNPNEATRRFIYNQGSGRDDIAVDITSRDDSLYLLRRRDFAGDNPPRWSYVLQEFDISTPGDPEIIAETRDVAGARALRSITCSNNVTYFLNGNMIQIVTSS